MTPQKSKQIETFMKQKETRKTKAFIEKKLVNPDIWRKSVESSGYGP
jgi:hypothetical protein